MTDILQLYFSAQLKPLKAPIMPFLLDYISSETDRASSQSVTIKSRQGAQNYILDYKGYQFQTSIPLDLDVGTRLPVTIRHSEQSGIVLDIPMKENESAHTSRSEHAPPKNPMPTSSNISTPEHTRLEQNIGQLLEKMQMTNSTENREATAALLKLHGPVNDESVRKVVYAAHRAQTPLTPSIETAAFLMSREIEPTPALTQLLTQAFLPYESANPISHSTMPPPSAPESPPPTPGTSTPISVPAETIPEALPPTQRLTSLLTIQTQEEFKALVSSFDQVIQQLSTIAEDRIRTILTSSRSLILMNELITHLEQLIHKEQPEQAAKASSQPAPKEILAHVQQLIKQTTTQEESNTLMKQIKEEIAKLPHSERSLLLSQIASIESSEIMRDEQLNALKHNKPPELQLHERHSAYRFVNQLSHLRDDGVIITEIPVSAHGVKHHIPVRLILQKDASHTKKQSQHMTISIDTNMSKIGNVKTHLKLAPKMANVQFTVKNAIVRDLFMKYRHELQTSLREMGFPGRVDVTINKRNKTSEETKTPGVAPLAGFAGPDSPYITIDISA